MMIAVLICKAGPAEVPLPVEPPAVMQLRSLPQELPPFPPRPTIVPLLINLEPDGNEPFITNA